MSKIKINKTALLYLLVGILVFSSKYIYDSFQTFHPNFTLFPDINTAELLKHASPVSVSNNAQVSIDGEVFSPQSITITIGRSVTWTNKDTVAHQIVFQDNVESEVLNDGSAYTRPFTVAGTYQYHDALNTEITGTVIVNQ